MLNRIKGMASSSGTFYRGPKYGLSLNEALLGPSVKPVLDGKFPNFDILGTDFDDYTTFNEEKRLSKA